MYSTISNKHRGSDLIKVEGCKISEKIKVKLGYIDAEPWINCVKSVAFLKKSRNVRISRP